MVATTAEVQSDIGRFIDLASSQSVVITEGGMPVARLLGLKKKNGAFLSDLLVGLIPSDADEDGIKAERLAFQ